MKIAICSSLDFTHELKIVADELTQLGFEVHIPHTSEEILKGGLTVDDIKQEKANGSFVNRAIDHDSIKKYYDVIKESDAILVTNYDKKSIKNYIGGNSFLEIGFAHILNKKIFLLHDIPDVPYADEIRAMRPTILNDDLSLIQ